VFYADVQSFAEVRSPHLTCEVFLDPRDDVSVLFHGTYGFREVGQQVLPSGHRVSLLAKELCSYPVRARHVLERPVRRPARAALARRARAARPVAAPRRPRVLTIESSRC
jgi:hypothetical protein